MGLLSHSNSLEALKSMCWDADEWNRGVMLGVVRIVLYWGYPFLLGIASSCLLSSHEPSLILDRFHAFIDLCIKDRWEEWRKGVVCYISFRFCSVELLVKFWLNVSSSLSRSNDV